MVILDAEIHETLNTKAWTAQNPYYPLAQGIDLESFRKVRSISIAFTIMDPDPAINSILNSSSVLRGDAWNNNKQVPAIDSLNGLGDGMRCNHSIMSRIVVLGVIEKADVNQYFNIIRQGILTVMNNGDRTIHIGSDVYAYAPSMEEIENSGLKTRELANHVVTLWYVPYDRNAHAIMPSSVLKCMVAQAEGDDEELRHYMPAYKKLCTNFDRAVCDLALVVVGAIGYEGMQQIMEESNDAAAMLNAFVKQTQTDAFGAKLPHMLFPVQSERGRWLEPGKREKSDLNKRQASAGSRFLRATQCFHEERERLKVGLALSTSMPGQPLLLQVKK